MPIMHIMPICVEIFFFSTVKSHLYLFLSQVCRVLECGQHGAR